MAGAAAIEMVTSLPTDSLNAEWLESGMQFQRVKAACQSETAIQQSVRSHPCIGFSWANCVAKPLAHKKRHPKVPFFTVV